MKKDSEKIKPIYVRLGNIAQQLGISKRSLERFISERNGNVFGRYQMPDRKSFIYNAAEFITYFNNQLITHDQLTKPIDLFKQQRSVEFSGHKSTTDITKHYVGL
jgi:hypothetical protein